MEIGQKNLLTRKVVIACCAVFCCLLSPCNAINWESDSVQQVPEGEILDLLDTFATQTKANYERIHTWQGQLAIERKSYYYGDMVKRLNIAKNDPAVNSSRIVRTVNCVAKFAIDIVKDKLYYEKSKPDVAYRALDLNRDVVVDEIYSPSRAIVTPEKFMYYEPELTYGSLGRVCGDSIVGKAAFLEPPEKAKADVPDPRRHFGHSHNTKIWDSLKKVRDTISEHGNALVAGQPHYKIEKVDTEAGSLYRITGRFFVSPADKSGLIQARLVLDGSVGYNLVHAELIDENGKIKQAFDLTYERIGDVFVPNNILQKVLNSKQEPKFDSKITFANFVLNETLLPETFTYKNLGLQNGVRFIDNIKGVEYIYKDGELILSYQLK